MSNEAFAFLKHPAPAGEAVAVHVEADSFDPATARPLRLASVRVKGDRILTGHRLELDCRGDGPRPDDVVRLLRHIGGRPLLGFFIDFSVSMLDRLAAPLIGGPLTNPRIEVSSVYYEYRPKTPGKNVVNLRLASILENLGLPPRPTPGAADTAISTALIWLRLRQRGG